MQKFIFFCAQKYVIFLWLKIVHLPGRFPGDAHASVGETNMLVRKFGVSPSRIVSLDMYGRICLTRYKGSCQHTAVSFDFRAL